MPKSSPVSPLQRCSEPVTGSITGSVGHPEPDASDHAVDMDGRRRSTSNSASRMSGHESNGSNSGGVVRRRGNTGDQSVLIPADFSSDKSGAGGSARTLDALRKLRSRQSACLTANTCKLILLGAAGLLLMYTLFLLVFNFMHTEDPCIVSQRNLAFVKNPTTRVVHQDDWEPVLPRIIHQQWKSTTITNSKYKMWSARWKELFPEDQFEHILWTDESQRELIKKHYEWFLIYYDGYKFNIQRADAVRYFIMYHYGGVYADLDYEPLEYFWEHLPKDRVSLIQSPYQYNEKVQNSFMSSPKRDPFWGHAFKTLVSQFGKPVLKATGPVFLDITVRTNPEPFLELPCHNFHRIPLGEHAQSPYLTLLHREVLGRIFPMIQCGNFDDLTCQFGRHHNTASYLKDTGILALLWT